MGLRAKPFTVGGVVVTFPKALASALGSGDGRFSLQVPMVAAALADRLPPA